MGRIGRYNVTVLEGKTVAAFGWLNSADVGPASDFVKSFSKIAVQDKADAAIRLLFEQLENTVPFRQTSLTFQT
jgi:hypothetical protein